MYLTKKGAIMILGSSFEFEKSSNPEVIERPTDNVEMPQVKPQKYFKLKKIQLLISSKS